MPPLSPGDYYSRLVRPWTPGPGDATRELAEIFTILSKPMRPAAPDPPAGMRWEWPGSWGQPGLVEFADALNGPWTPGSRPNLQSVVLHLESPETPGTDCAAAFPARPAMAPRPVGLAGWRGCLGPVGIPQRCQDTHGGRALPACPARGRGGGVGGHQDGALAGRGATVQYANRFTCAPRPVTPFVVPSFDRWQPSVPLTLHWPPKWTPPYWL